MSDVMPHIDTVAMAYVMAFNKLSADMLQACKKAYRKGIADGENVGDEVINTTEDYEDNTTDDINITCNDGTDVSSDSDATTKIIDPFAGDWKSGVTIDYGNTSFRLYVTDEQWNTRTNVANEVIRHTGKLMCDRYDDGVFTSTQTVTDGWYAYDYTTGWNSVEQKYDEHWENTKYISDIKLSCVDNGNGTYSNRVYLTSTQVYADGRANDVYDWYFNLGITTQRTSVTN